MAQRQANPADETNTPSSEERTRIPFNTIVSRLSVPEIPGYHLHWFNGTPQRIQRARAGGYEFVRDDEVLVNNNVLGSDPAEDGNTDMGTLVSQPAGGDAIDANGQAVRLHLMKIKEELWQADQKALTAPGSRLDGVRNALVGGQIGQENQPGTDRSQVYLDPKRTKIPDFFKRKT